MSSAPASDHKPILLSTYYLADIPRGTRVRPGTSLSTLKSLGKRTKGDDLQHSLLCGEWNHPVPSASCFLCGRHSAKG